MIDPLIDSLKNQMACFASEMPQEKDKYRYITLQISVSEPIPLLPVNMDQSFFLTKPHNKNSLLGLGALLTFHSQGDKRFKSIKANYANLLGSWKADKNTLPIAFMAFAFDENDPMTENWQVFPNTSLTVPVILIEQNGLAQNLFVNIELKKTSLDNTFKHIKELLEHYLELTQQSVKMSHEAARFTVNQSHSLTDQDAWQTLSHNAITQIQSGKFDKLVTSRQYSLQTKNVLPKRALVAKLIKHYPTCTIFSYQLSGTYIISASPERLVSLQHPEVQSDAIGGTILRNDRTLLPLPFKQSILPTPSESSLDQKLLKEHAFITQDIYHRLAPLCSTLKMPVSPFLMKLQNLFHLESTIQGKLMSDYTLFDVIETLHPTPAIAGFPARQAKQWLLNNENYRRGWYTGAFGWIDGKQNGELAVMLRCALIKDKQVDLFAGAGLVAESDPEIEWQETELKMQTILEML